jgi:hypothetical protein
LVYIYSTFIRSCIQYASPAWSALTKQQSDLIETIQKRALRIIVPETPYTEALDRVGLQTVAVRRQELCKTFMNKLNINGDANNPIKNAVTNYVHSHDYGLRHASVSKPRVNTERFKNFITVKYR